MKHLLNYTAKINKVHRIAIVSAIQLLLILIIGLTCYGRIQNTHEINCNSTYVSDDGFYKIKIIMIIRKNTPKKFLTI